MSFSPISHCPSLSQASAQGTVQLHTQLSTFKYDPNDLIDSPGLPMTEFDMGELQESTGEGRLLLPATQGLVFRGRVRDRRMSRTNSSVPSSTSTASPITTPLFQSCTHRRQRPTSARQIQQNVQLYHLFGEFMAAVHTCADSETLRLCEYLGKDIKVDFVRASVFQSHEPVRERVTLRGTLESRNQVPQSGDSRLRTRVGHGALACSLLQYRHTSAVVLCRSTRLRR